VARKPLTREQELVQRLRKAAYVTREQRVENVKNGEQPYAHFTDEELLEIIPGRRVSWLSNTAHLTPQPDQPLWAEHEAVVHISGKRFDFDPAARTLTFQDQEWMTRTIKLENIFEVTIRVIPEREIKKAATPGARRRQMTKRVVVG
jgi:hypothetical protein